MRKIIYNFFKKDRQKSYKYSVHTLLQSECVTLHDYNGIYGTLTSDHGKHDIDAQLGHTERSG